MLAGQQLLSVRNWGLTLPEPGKGSGPVFAVSGNDT